MYSIVQNSLTLSTGNTLLFLLQTKKNSDFNCGFFKWRACKTDLKNEAPWTRVLSSNLSRGSQKYIMKNWFGKSIWQLHNLNYPRPHQRTLIFEQNIQKSNIILVYVSIYKQKSSQYSSIPFLWCCKYTLN